MNNNINVITQKKELYDKCENMEELYDKYYLPLLEKHYKKTYILEQALDEIEKYIVEYQEERTYTDRGGFTCIDGHFLRDSDDLLKIIKKAKEDVKNKSK